MPETAAKIGDVADEAGLRRIHILAWRDLDDVEAGGSEVHADQVARRWAAAGIDVTMRTSHAQGQLPTGMRHGYRVVRRSGRHLVFPDVALSGLLGGIGPRDALLEVWNGMPFFTPLWARGPRVTFIHHVHAQMWRQALTPGLARIGELVELGIAPVLYHRSRILTPSESSRLEIVEHLRIPADRVSAVPNGVDPRFAPGGVRSPHPLVIAVGRLVPHKRIDALLDALAVVREDHPDLEAVIIGDGYERGALESRAHERNMESWVRFTGHVDDDALLDWCRRAWLLVSASSAEGWGMTITEAAACGTPAVVTRIAGHVDAVAEGRSGLLADSPAELAEPISRVLGDHELRQQLGEGAQKYAAQFTWDRTALEILRALADEALLRRR
ncbi:MAG: glycosyltransferase family 4 protein [Acidimicrobiia bacterium]|nr:glycosyltransferase family 4 protein [Acidimicrobiia bacterium]